MWSQVYDPLGSMALSTIAAAVPVVVLRSAGVLSCRPTWRPAGAGRRRRRGVIRVRHACRNGWQSRRARHHLRLFPIGWIVLNIIFLHRLTTKTGRWVLQDSISGITEDRRLQLLLVAFSFGAFFEGAAGFGTPVAVTGAILIGLGFSPLAASGLALIANTAPVAFGALGAPIIGWPR
jgi:lactate permease